MTKVSDVIGIGETIPDDVTRVADKDEHVWEWQPGARWFCVTTHFGTTSIEAEVLSREWAPLRVTAVREPKPERTLIGPPHAHLDAPCTDKCYEAAPAEPGPSAADVSPLLDLVRQYGDDRAEAARRVATGGLALDVLSRAETLLDRIAALVPQQPDPSVLSLPQVPEGAKALVGEMGRIWEWKGGPTPWFCALLATYTDLAGVLAREGSVTVVMREPRTWPRLDAISHDLKAVQGASGKVYRRSHFSQSVPVFRERGNDGDPLTGPGHMFYALQTFDGPLTEVFEDEPGGEPR